MINDDVFSQNRDKIITRNCKWAKNFFKESLAARVNADNFVVLIEYLNKDILEDELNSIIKKNEQQLCKRYGISFRYLWCMLQKIQKNDVIFIRWANMARKYAKDSKTNKLVFITKLWVKFW